MFGSQRSGANAYAKVGVETGVLSASPHKLIAMLFDGALVALSTALVQMKAGNIAAKGQAISKAITIIDEGLRASLDKSAGGGIAVSLDALYEYMGGRLLTANLNNQPELIEEVQRLLGELKQAWDQIAPGAGAPAQAAMALPPSAALAGYGAGAPRAANMIKA
ncbi:flagellar export chaperone FliS [Massilia sp. R2A-15]|uniref:flagellar export chaperone FliS n=1 Tax=Massilia sp. R2A-15 TaxID=3064278 RepID=UPI0027355D48|nr:flagellar export chaperone FliS [Massilia sp. R2A-15]WLI87967.1 flagellar export chaperone FliS [Massilia sp. R2A-15]